MEVAAVARHTGGWVKIWRTAVLGDIGSNFTRSGLFSTLIAIANIKESTISWAGKPRTLHRGQIATSLHELAKLGEVDVKTVSRHLAYLQLRNTIKVEKSSSGTIVTMLNYEQYQSQDAEGSTRPPHDRDNDVHTIGNAIGIYSEEEKKKRRKEYSELPPIAIAWNESVGSLPKVIGWSAARAKSAKTILAVKTIFEWAEACRRVEDSEFLSGRDGKWTSCGFDWLLKKANLTKVLEGNYQNRTQATSASGTDWAAEAEFVLKTIRRFSSDAFAEAEAHMGPERSAIVREAGGMGRIRMMPSNDFTTMKLAGILKIAAEQLAKGGAA